MLKRRDVLADKADGENGMGGVKKGSEEGERCGPVVWGVFGLTHNPRMEDWPVM